MKDYNQDKDIEDYMKNKGVRLIGKVILQEEITLWLTKRKIQN